MAKELKPMYLAAIERVKNWPHTKFEQLREHVHTFNDFDAGTLVMALRTVHRGTNWMGCSKSHLLEDIFRAKETPDPVGANRYAEQLLAITPDDFRKLCVAQVQRVENLRKSKEDQDAAAKKRHEGAVATLDRLVQSAGHIKNHRACPVRDVDEFWKWVERNLRTTRSVL